MKSVKRMMIVIGLALALWVPASYAQNVFVANRIQSTPIYLRFCNFALPNFDHPANGPCIYQPGCYAGTNQQHCPNLNKNEYSMFLEVPPGTYVVTAKTTMQSLDSGAQPGACRLMFLRFFPSSAFDIPSPTTLSTLVVLDRTDYTISKKSEGNQYSVSGQAVFTTPAPPPGEPTAAQGGSFVFECYGYNQWMLDRVIIATKVVGNIVNDTEPYNSYSNSEIQAGTP